MISLHEPFFDKNEEKFLLDCIKSSWVSTVGKNIVKFEKKISDFTGAKYAISCVNGTAALQISLLLLGVKKNEEVITPSLTFIAPINAIKYNNANPIFMDSNNFYTVDEDKTIEFIKNKTSLVAVKKNNKSVYLTINNKSKKIIRGLIVVHTFGNAVNLIKLKKLCDERKIKIVEDAAESLGSFYTAGKYTGKHVGTIGEFGCISFNGNKIITSGGGGMILTNNKLLAKKAKYLINQAKNDSIFYKHDEIGYNFRLTNLQASLGLAQFDKLKKYLYLKNKIHLNYKIFFDNYPNFKISECPKFASSNYWLNILEINKKISKDKFKKIIYKLKKLNIDVRPLWLPNHLQTMYRANQTYKVNNIKAMYLNRLCLPSSPMLSLKDINFVCKSIIKVID